MNLSIKIIAAAACLTAVAAYAQDRVFTSTGPREANACVQAENAATNWANRSLIARQYSVSQCACRGGNQDGWFCQVTISY